MPTVSTVTALTSLDTTRSIGSVALRDVTVPEDRVLRGAARKARTVFRILAAAEAVGISWATLEMAVEYAKVREQFGRTIGTFQAVKHHAANMLVDAEQTTAATWDAARADDLDGAWFAAAVAASHAIRTQIFNAECNIQLHGGIGFTWEHDAHLYLRRARTLAAIMADGADPLFDVVDGQRSGQAHGASFDPARGGRGVPRRRPRGRRDVAVAARRPAARLPGGLRLPGAALAEAVGPGRRGPRAVGDRGGVRGTSTEPTWASPAG